MKKVIIFGAGGMGKGIYEEIKERCQVTMFWDNGSDGKKEYEGIPICKPALENMKEVDEVILGACYPSIREQLLSMNVPEYKINDRWVERRISGRISFLKNFAALVYSNGIVGNCAEGGVFQGEFAQYINQYFPDRKVYLFDTFEGFAESDVIIEKNRSFSEAQIGQYSLTSEELVIAKMKYPNNCIIKKGIFPSTAQNINDSFCFVNLDMDLYQPTIEGLKFFGPKMEKNGVILVHDYFSHYQGVKQAISEFMSTHPQYRLLPIGDEISIAITGF